MKLLCDNKVAPNIARNLAQLVGLKHIEIDKTFYQEAGMRYHSHAFATINKQLPGIFSKWLKMLQFDSSVSKLGVSDIFEPASGIAK